MKTKLKYVVVYDEKEEEEEKEEEREEGQQTLSRINNNTLEDSTIEAQVISILTSVSLFLTIFYMYYTSRSKLRFKITNNSASYTFSEAVESAEKIGSIVLIILFLALLQCLFTIQNFNRYNFERASLVAVNYIVVLGLILMFYINPGKQIGHGFIAIILTLTIIFTSSMINMLYHKFYTTESLESLNILSNLMLAFFCLLIFVFFLFAISRFSGKYYVIVHHILSISELFMLLLYGIFIIYFGQLPKLMSDDDLACLIFQKENNS